MIDFLITNWPFTLVFSSLLLVQLAVWIAGQQAAKPPASPVAIPQPEPVSEPSRLTQAIEQYIEARDKAEKELDDDDFPWEMKLETEPVRINGELRHLCVDLIAVLPDRVIFDKSPKMDLPECEADIIVKIDGSTYRQRVIMTIGIDADLRMAGYMVKRRGLLTGMATDLPEWIQKKMFSHNQPEEKEKPDLPRA